MDYNDDFYTDEPISISSPLREEDNAVDGQNGHKYDYVEAPEPISPYSPPSGMSSPPLGGGGTESLPRDIRQLLEMVQKSQHSLNFYKNFYDQALFMAGYTDDAPIVPFHCYFPLYSGMKASQLRSYFTIRKLLRLGQHPDVPLSYLFVFVYETLMQIGIAEPEEGYEILCDLRDSYPEMDKGLQPYMTEWIRDYVVWYGLPEHFAECFATEQLDGTAYDIVSHYATATDDDLFTALDGLAKHCLTKSALYKKQPQAAVAAVASVVRSIAPSLEKRYGAPLASLVFGEWRQVQHLMFNRAVFYTPSPVKEATVTVSPSCRFICKNGIWRRWFTGGYIALSRTQLKAMLHDIDALMRERLGVKPQVKRLSLPGLHPIALALGKAVETWHAEWKASEAQRQEAARREAIEQARRSVSIDLSLLGKIREDADVVREKLIVEAQPLTPPPPRGGDDMAIGQIEHEDQPDHVDHTSTIVAPTSGLDIPSPPLSGGGVRGGASAFLSLLLSGGDYKAYLRETHTMAGVIVEEINNKAMDIIGDIVLEDDGQEITVIEDYREDIKHLYD